jgi:integrase
MSKRSGQSGHVAAVGKKWVGRYWCDVLGKDQREHAAVVLGTRKEMTKSEAKRKLMDMLFKDGINSDTHLARSLKPAITFDDVAADWKLKRLPQLKVSTRYSAPKQIAKHLTPFFGALPLESIKTGTINEWLAGLDKLGLEPKTVHNQWKQFRAVMNWHAQQNDVPKRAWYPTLPMIPDTEQRWFTQDEMRKIITAATGQYKPLFQLAGYSRLRSGELTGLHVEDLDLERGVVRVRRSVWRGKEVTVKTRRGYRDVNIDTVTVRMLREYLAGRTTGRVFQTKNGTSLENHNIVRQVLKPICKRLGIAPGGMHAFRHGRVSHLQANNVPGDFTKNQVGHSSLRTTSGYTHFSEEYKRDIVERLSCTQTEVCTQL